MRSWPTVYLPPTLGASKGSHPDLVVIDSYSGERVKLTDSPFSIYVCGITPYAATHLGQDATYLTFDLINRFQIASGKELNFSQNVTDIDDPLLERAERDSKDWEELAYSQIQLFREDMTELRVIPPNYYLGVVESMNTVIRYIQALVDTGKTYILARDMYLDLGAIPGALERLPMPIDEAIKIFQARGGDPSREGKRHPLDTLIWSGEKPDEPSWQSQFGPGRPGWHIECVAIALNTLTGSARVEDLQFSLTLQGGGSDLRFPHHYMTNVQSRAITGREFARAYLHTGMISWQGEKMSKSLGNLVFVSKLREEGWSGNEIRFALINRHLTGDFDWKMERLENARNALARISSALSREEVAPTEAVVREIQSALAEGLDVPRAINAIFQWCSATESGIVGGMAGELSRAMDLYLGIAL
ncbi:MAG: cysteine--1-D-myo-inosityl 2-amino-2-deoxy-alpha-D-glucopyranoside ligase [Candidatus Nanopelagicaceae bacterium]